jgi:hypothetical protein
MDAPRSAGAQVADRVSASFSSLTPSASGRYHTASSPAVLPCQQRQANRPPPPAARATTPAARSIPARPTATGSPAETPGRFISPEPTPLRRGSAGDRREALGKENGTRAMTDDLEKGVLPGGARGTRTPGPLLAKHGQVVQHRPWPGTGRSQNPPEYSKVQACWCRLWVSSWRALLSWRPHVPCALVGRSSAASGAGHRTACCSVRVWSTSIRQRPRALAGLVRQSTYRARSRHVKCRAR